MSEEGERGGFPALAAALACRQGAGPSSRSAPRSPCAPYARWGARRMLTALLFPPSLEGAVSSYVEVWGLLRRPALRHRDGPARGLTGATTCTC